MKRFIPASIFGVSFGFLEAIVVVYLRAIYYPDGFRFPLTFLDPQMLRIEIVREFCTIIMLATIGWILGKTKGERFSFFIFTFGVWDIFYYVALKLFLDWPQTILEWDVLFLIPITWIGPVLAPVICSIGMIIIALIYVYLSEKNYQIKFSSMQLILISAGVLIIIYTFIYDYLNLFTENNFWTELSNITEKQKFWDVIQNYVPQKFNWVLFTGGCLLIGMNYLYSFLKAEIKN
ncbi:MAG: hypothetical protein NUV92_07015 [Ignavibacteria bacterium]|jgi:uncharacterized membrane protein|nr:hypothetical protein [Ignavibacteria bacterium]MDH7528242.1 hypothetical protein [Ignavibacteria bacterium]